MEKEEQAGGWIRTDFRDGFLFEQGPRGCRPKGLAGAETLRLIEELGLQKEVITANSRAHSRYLLIKKKLTKLPTGIFSFLTFPYAWDIIKGAINDWRTPPSNQDDETIHHFISRRFGNRVAERLFDPLVTGIYGGDISKLSMHACFPKVVEWEQRAGSVLKGAFFRKNREVEVFSRSQFVEGTRKFPLYSFKKGMGTLTNELARQLEPHLRLNCPVVGLNLYPSRVEVKLADGSLVEGDHLFSTLSAKAMVPLLMPHRQLVDNLRAIPTVSMAVVNLGYYTHVLPKKGYGYLVPSQENEEIMGMVWDSEIFPQQNRIPEETRLSVMIGGAYRPQIETESEDQLREIACRAVQDHLNVTAPPDCVSVRLAKDAIPQYWLGHKASIKEIENALSHIFRNLTLCGSSYYGVAVNDCIAKSREIVENYR